MVKMHVFHHEFLKSCKEIFCKGLLENNRIQLAQVLDFEEFYAKNQHV